jgi:hypothetical protein
MQVVARRFELVTVERAHRARDLVVRRLSSKALPPDDGLEEELVRRGFAIPPASAS